MAEEKKDKKKLGNIRINPGSAQAGLNLDSSVSQVGPGKVTYALNAAVENFDDNSVSYQNELGNELCLTLPTGYKLIGQHYIQEKRKHIFFIVNPISEQSEIGFMDNNDCQYQTLVSAPCLNFNIQHPIPKVVHRITNCTTEIYWTDGINPRRYLDIENIPYKLIDGTPSCDPVYGDELDCNQLKIQPNFSIPQLDIVEVNSTGDLTAGTYQFAVQYADAGGNELTSYYSVTNPTPIFDEFKTSVNFDFQVGKSIVVKVSNLDLTGQFQYFNLAVIKTINNISSVELIGTYNVEESTKEITYTGADKTLTQLAILDIFEKFPYYDIANDVTAVQDVIVWNNLTSIDRTNYQSIASNITFQWETYRIPPGEDYSDELNATNLRGYMRDEVYAFEIVFLLRNGKQTDGFHIPGRVKNNNENQPDVPNTNNDFIGEADYSEVTPVSYYTYNVCGVIPSSFIKSKFTYVNLEGETITITLRGDECVEVDSLSEPIIIFGNATIEVVGDEQYFNTEVGYSEWWKIYNTGSVIDFSDGYDPNAKNYKGPYQYGELAYWESTEEYPCNDDVWGDLAGQKIRHHKFPDVLVSPIIENAELNIEKVQVRCYTYNIINFSSFDLDLVYKFISCEDGEVTEGTLPAGESIKVCSQIRPKRVSGTDQFTTDRITGPFGGDICENSYGETDRIIPELQNDNAIFPIGIRIDENQITSLIASSNLTEDQKADIVGYKIVRGDRGTNRSIVAKGMLRNVGEYERDDEKYYYPNYPYNDLNPDPFLNDINNAYTENCESYIITVFELNSIDENGIPCFIINYTSCNNNKPATKTYYTLGEQEDVVCSLSKPAIQGPGIKNTLYYTPTIPSIPQPSLNNPPVGWVSYANYDIWQINATQIGALFTAVWDDPIADIPLGACCGGYVSGQFNDGNQLRLRVGTEVRFPDEPRIGQSAEKIREVRNITCGIEKSETISSSNLSRQVFNSPETSFGQPFLGSVLKLESVMFGAGKAHFVEVKDNAKYKLLSKEAQEDALESAEEIGGITDDFNAGAMFTVYQSYLTIYVNGITRKNYGMSFNSRASYDYSLDIDNNVDGGIKQRDIDFSKYLIPGVQSLRSDEKDINNWNRESSVFIKTDGLEPLPFPNNTPTVNPEGVSPLVSDVSRFTISDRNLCGRPSKEEDISVLSYYASMKNIIPNQWGQIYSYQTIDTGFQALTNQFSANQDKTSIVFGGDVFISKFAYKTKLPFFIDNRVGAPDDSDIFYDEIGNVAYPKYWHSSRSILEDYIIDEDGDAVNTTNIISYKANNFDCPNDPSILQKTDPSRTFYDGYMYNFAYGVPSFYCESTYNTDLRQAFNNKEGDFWPHVSSGIPDDWVQESNVPIAQDNTYYYNVTFSKQNKENSFTHLPPDWSLDFCFTNFPFRAIYSDAAATNADNRVNNWLVYRALSFYDFPQNYGNLISLDGIQNKAILARFENKSLLYNNLLTIDTSNPQAAYIGNPNLFSAAPPIDFAETDLGYVGTQNKFLLKIPQGQVTIDAKRGQVFLIAGKAIDLTAFNSGVNKFMKDELPFHILRFFPTVDTDNHFNGIGLHGVYDSKFERIIITKLDYAPLSDNIAYDEEGDFFYNKTVRGRTPISLNNQKYFCNKSWTISFDFNIKAWVSFHSYLPNFYIGDNAFFYSGKNDCCDDNFEVIAGELQAPSLITTTSTSTSPPLFTTTTTTTAAPDCDLSGGLFVETSCILEGTAVITIPPSTTTTTTTQIPSVQYLAYPILPEDTGTIEYIDPDGIPVGPITITEGLYFCALLGSVIQTGDIIVYLLGECFPPTTSTTTTTV